MNSPCVTYMYREPALIMEVDSDMHCVVIFGRPRAPQTGCCHEAAIVRYIVLTRNGANVRDTYQGCEWARWHIDLGSLKQRKRV